MINRWADPMGGVCHGPLMAAMGGLGQVLSIGGTILGAAGAIQSGNAQQAASVHQAAQLDAAAKTERASAQRAAEEERRQSRLAISRARAVGAASGGGQDIPLLGQIEEDGELRAQTAMWEGEEAAKGRKMQASAARFEGSQYKRAGTIGAGSTILGGMGRSFLDIYG